jgi:hypothetical protein
MKTAVPAVIAAVIARAPVTVGVVGLNWHQVVLHVDDVNAPQTPRKTSTADVKLEDPGGQVAAMMRLLGIVET